MRTENFKRVYSQAREYGFTAQDLYDAGPLFNPDHPTCIEAQTALRVLRLADTVERKHNQLLGADVLAQQDVKMASRMLSMARLASNSLSFREYQAQALATIRHRELAVLNAHDKLWAAQRALKLWELTYGEQP